MRSMSESVSELHFVELIGKQGMGRRSRLQNNGRSVAEESLRASGRCRPSLFRHLGPNHH